MTNIYTHPKGYSKKELLEIIEKIDADQNIIKNQTQKTETNSENNDSYFSGNMVTPDK